MFRLSRSRLVIAALLPVFAFAQSAPGEEHLRGLRGMEEYRIRKFETDAQGMVHTWADQLFGGHAVWGGEAIVHLKKDGSLSSVTQAALLELRAPVEPRVSPEEARQIAEGYVLATVGALSPEPTTLQLYVMRFRETDRLAYEVQIGTIEDDRIGMSLPLVRVDAVSGEVFDSYDSIQHGIGQTLYAGQQNFPTEFGNNRYYLMNHFRKMHVKSAGDDKNQGTAITATTPTFGGSHSDGPTDTWVNMLHAHDYFLQTHGLLGVDGEQGPGSDRMLNNQRAFTAVCDYGKPGTNAALNAYWNPLREKIYLGGAAGWAGYDDFVSCDIVAHEMAHGVDQYTARIAPGRETGAVKEHIGDVFGAMVERFRDGAVSADTWLIGEDVVLSGGGPDGFRSMIEPELFGDPDHMTEADFFGTGDAGGVHANAGVPNKAFTLVAVGGTHSNHPRRFFTGIGFAKAERIWMHALRFHMGRYTTFKRAREATIEASRELFGDLCVEQVFVAEAWDTVGVNP